MRVWREMVHKGMDILFANGGTLSLTLMRVWAVGRKPRIFPGSYTLRNITLALLVPKHRFQHQLTAEIYKPR